MEVNGSDISIGVEVSTAINESSKTWNTVPPELLEKILAHFHNLSNPSEMAPLRQVCKLWGDVIDEHFHFQVAVNDKKMDVNQLSHLRVTPSVGVSSLLTPLDPNSSVFRNPSDITELKIWGAITPSNFQHLLKETTNLTKLSLNSSALRSQDLIEPVQGVGADFLQTWRQLTALDMTNPKPENLLSLLSTQMTNLTIFKLSFRHESDLPFPMFQKITEALFAFLDRSRSLQVLHLLPAAYHYAQMNTPLPVYDGEKQLEILKLTTNSSMLRCWLPLAMVQRTLKDLQVYITDYDYPKSLPIPEEVCLCTALEATLRLNEATLTSVYLKNLSLSLNLNAAMFGNMCNLRRLVLNRFDKARGQTLIFNLGMLPNSIEILNLRKFTYEAEDLQRMADRLENVKEIELTYMKRAGDPDLTVSYRVLESFARKMEISSLVVFPLDPPTLDENLYEYRDNKHFMFLNGSWQDIFFRRGGFLLKCNFQN